MKLAASLFFSALATLCPVSQAWAWGSKGHEAVAELAGSLLTPTAQARVSEILAQEPGATLASISNWADVTRSRSTAPWHYVNMPRDVDCDYDRLRDCPADACVVEALKRQAERLISSPSPADKLEALKYVVHLTADIHQPLHAAFADDRGGNSYQIQAYGRGTNLHALWDTVIVESLASNGQGPVASLAPLPTSGQPGSILPEEWATESCRIASQTTFYPGRRVTQDYLAAYGPIAAERLRLAAIRLAALLNRTFDGK